jgi:uncharacterized membrane protein
MTEKPKTSWKKYLLIGSLALNVLVVFAIAGAAFKPDRPKLKDREVSIQGSFMRALPEDMREQLKDSFRKGGEGFRKQRETSRKLREEMKVVISATPYEDAALRAVFEKQKQLRIAFVDRGDSVLIELISSMTDEQRAEFAKNLRFGKPGGKPKN